MTGTDAAEYKQVTVLFAKRRSRKGHRTNGIRLP
jgi:hypothetical protein